MPLKKKEANNPVNKYLNPWIKSFKHELNQMKLVDAIEYLQDKREKLWLIPGAIWLITTITILSGAITTLNWALFAIVLHLVNMANLLYLEYIDQYIYNFTTRRNDLDQQTRVAELWKVKRSNSRMEAIAQGASFTLVFAFCICPYIEFLRLNPTRQGWNTGMFDQVVGSPLFVRAMFWTLPIMQTWFSYKKMITDEDIYKSTINTNLETRRYHDPELHDVLTGYHKTSELPEEKPARTRDRQLINREPYVTIGTSIRTGETVELAPVQRKQNAIYFGPIGSGKTSTIFIPQIKQDIDHYLRYVRDYPRASQTEGFMKDKRNEATNYLNSIVVVETSNDLCTSVYNLARQMGVPEKQIIWFDPSNPSTPSLNLLRGPIPNVTENVSNIINGVKTENSDFFQESERTHLKMYITLLKMSAVVEQKIPDFSDLVDMYNDVYLVIEKREYLKKYIEILQTEVDNAEEKMNANPDSAILRTEYLEILDKYRVASDCLKWVEHSIQPKTFGQGVLTHTVGENEGKIIYEDINNQNIAGLRNTLSDLSQNTLLRRLLFRDSGNFSFDDFYRNGGIMLCNTGKAELQDSLAKTIGQVYMICLATAAVRRKPDTAPLCTIYADEFPDFIYSNFTSFLAQARKYNISIVIAAQTIAQIARDYGNEYAETVMSNMLTRGAFGDLAPGDAKRLEPYFGESYKRRENVQNQDVDGLASNESNGKSVSVRNTLEPNISASELMALQKFTIAVRHPDAMGSEAFDVIKTQFLTDKEILEDPNIFDMTNERDEHAYEVMLSDTFHGNPDLDEIDEEINRFINEQKSKGESFTVTANDMVEYLFKKNKNGAYVIPEKFASQYDLGKLPTANSNSTNNDKFKRDKKPNAKINGQADNGKDDGNDDNDTPTVDLNFNPNEADALKQGANHKGGGNGNKANNTGYAQGENPFNQEKEDGSGDADGKDTDTTSTGDAEESDLDDLQKSISSELEDLDLPPKHPSSDDFAKVFFKPKKTGQAQNKEKQEEKVEKKSKTDSKEVPAKTDEESHNDGNNEENSDNTYHQTNTADNSSKKLESSESDNPEGQNEELGTESESGNAIGLSQDTETDLINALKPLHKAEFYNTAIVNPLIEEVVKKILKTKTEDEEIESAKLEALRKLNSTLICSKPLKGKVTREWLDMTGLTDAVTEQEQVVDDLRLRNQKAEDGFSNLLKEFDINNLNDKLSDFDPTNLDDFFDNN